MVAATRAPPPAPDGGFSRMDAHRLDHVLQSLLDVYAVARARSADEGFAALLAYEAQSPDVAATKAHGLREHGIVDRDGALRFWDLHAALDRDHAAWALDALSAGDTDEQRIAE